MAWSKMPQCENPYGVLEACAFYDHEDSGQLQTPTTAARSACSRITRGLFRPTEQKEEDQEGGL